LNIANVIYAGVSTGLLFFVYNLISNRIKKNKLLVTKDNSNIRTRPNIESQIIEVVNCGTELKFDDKIGYWFKVKTHSAGRINATGYIHEQRVMPLGKQKDAADQHQAYYWSGEDN